MNPMSKCIDLYNNLRYINILCFLQLNENIVKHLFNILCLFFDLKNYVYQVKLLFF